MDLRSRIWIQISTNSVRSASLTKLLMQVVLLGLHAHLNSLFAHLIEFNIHYHTIEDKETEVLQVETLRDVSEVCVRYFALVLLFNREEIYRIRFNVSLEVFCKSFQYFLFCLELLLYLKKLPKTLCFGCKSSLNLK